MPGGGLFLPVVALLALPFAQAVPSGIKPSSTSLVDDVSPQMADAEANARAAEATIEAVNADLKRMSTFSEEVERNLKEETQAKRDMEHALGYFRRQIELNSGERDGESVTRKRGRALRPCQWCARRLHAAGSLRCSTWRGLAS